MKEYTQADWDEYAEWAAEAAKAPYEERDGTTLVMNISTREKKMEIIDTTAPEGYEVAETTLAKNTVMALLDDLGNPACTEYPKLDETGDGLVVIPDIIGMADKIVEKLIAMGWRPTRAMKEDPHA